MTCVGAVIIGRNEGQRLVECIRSVRACIGTVVYVDSGSTDGSVARAEAEGVRCIALVSGPYTAARGRQAGSVMIEREFPETECILFIDGDCVLNSGFATAALTHMRDHPRTGAVAGRVREQGAGFWSRVIDIEWAVPAGPVAFVGGISLMRAPAIREAGGWPAEVIAGEEPDLCLRMRDYGWESHVIPVEMALHDARISRLQQYWRRCVRAGHAYAEVAWRRRAGEHADRARAVASIVLYGLVLPPVIVAAILLYWPAAILLALLYVRLLVVVALRTWRSGRGVGLALAYAALTVLGKFAGVLGVARYTLGRLTGSKSRIIEYHAPTPSATTPNNSGPASVPLGKSP